MNWWYPVSLKDTQLWSLRATLKFGMNQGFLGQTRAQIEDDYKDNSIIIQSCEMD